LSDEVRGIMAKKKRLYFKIQEYLKRKQAVSRPLAMTFTKVNQIVRGG